MLPDRVSNPGPLTYESGALPIALSGLVLIRHEVNYFKKYLNGFIITLQMFELDYNYLIFSKIIIYS